MERLIDADKLKESTEILYERESGYDWEENLVENYEPVAAVKAEAIYSAPTVDAVEVVRCKDCINSDPKPYPNGRVWCWENAHFVPENHFCSYCKRRENG